MYLFRVEGPEAASAGEWQRGHNRARVGPFQAVLHRRPQGTSQLCNVISVFVGGSGLRHRRPRSCAKRVGPKLVGMPREIARNGSRIRDVGETVIIWLKLCVDSVCILSYPGIGWFSKW